MASLLETKILNFPATRRIRRKSNDKECILFTLAKCDDERRKVDLTLDDGMTISMSVSSWFADFLQRYDRQKYEKMRIELGL